MNHLDKLADLRMGPPWTSCERAVYRMPFEDLDPRDIKCWHNDFHGPVLDGDDLKALEWTTAEYSVLDDGRLDLIDCADAGRHVQITPLLFTGPDGAMRLGWPMAGYVDPNKGARWGRIGPAEVVAVRAALSDPAIGVLPSTAVGEPPVESSIPRPPPMLRPIEPAPRAQEFQPMPNGPSHISGTFVVHLSNEEIEDMIEDNIDQSPPFIEEGEIRVTRAIQTKDVIEAAAEKVSPRYADLVADTESAVISGDGEDGFKVTFEYELDI